MKLPDELLYSETHEWVRLEGDRATTGITDFAQNQLTDIVYVDIPEIGKKLKKGESLGVVESVKSVSDLYSPLSGKIVEVNENLKDRPQLINEDPYGKGWIVKIELENREELKRLLSAHAYKGTLMEEG